MHNLKTQALVFKGYRKGKDAKIPANRNLYAYEEVKNCDNYGANCNDGIIDLSFDDVDMSNKILDILAQKNIYTYCIYSPHGVHTYWHTNKKIKDATNVILALGIKADIHSHGTYIPLKCNGELREEVFENSDFESIPELPDMLMPTTSKDDLWQLKDGDGRNDALSRHVFALAKVDMSEIEINELFHIINDNIFADSISEDEINTILRKETFDKLKSAQVFDEYDKFDHTRMGELLKEKYNVIRYNGVPYMYDFDKNLYVSGDYVFHSKMIEIYTKILKKQRTEVYEYLLNSPSVKTIESESDPDYINFGNGIYDLRTNTLLPHSPEYFITNKIKWDYNPNAYCESVDRMINKVTCDDKELRLVLEEMIGYCMYRAVPYKKFFVLYGGKDNGKSTFIFALENMLGIDNISSEDIPNLTNEYSIAMVASKLANIKDDIVDGYFDGIFASLIKELVGGNRLRGRFPYGIPFYFYPYATLIFSANEMPKFKDTKDSALIEKLIKIPFNAHITKDDPDYNPNIIEELQTEEAMEYMVLLGINGLQRLIKNKGFILPDKIIAENEQYRLDNSPILQFIREVGKDEILNQSSKDVYARYEVFCSEEGRKPLNKSEVHKYIKSELGYKLSEPRRINDKILRIYIE